MATKNFEIIEKRAEECELEGLYYLVAIDEDGCQICEIDGSESYCYDCAKTRAEELTVDLMTDGYLEFVRNHDCGDSDRMDEAVKIDFYEESSPEKDDFRSCETCGKEINVGVLFTYDDEIRYWIDQDFDVNDLTPQDAYRIHECITSEEANKNFPKLVRKLKNKIAAL